jgi:hypothetical protein
MYAYTYIYIYIYMCVCVIYSLFDWISMTSIFLFSKERWIVAVSFFTVPLFYKFDAICSLEFQPPVWCAGYSFVFVQYSATILQLYAFHYEYSRSIEKSNQRCPYETVTLISQALFRLMKCRNSSKFVWWLLGFECFEVWNRKAWCLFTRTDLCSGAATHELMYTADVNFGSVFKTIFVILFILVLRVVTVQIYG